MVVVWCGGVWCGVVWCGVVWCGVVWCGVVWCGVVWCGVVWCVYNCMNVCVQLHVCVCTTAWVCVQLHGCVYNYMGVWALLEYMHAYVHTNVHVFDVYVYNRRLISSISALWYTVHEYNMYSYPLYMLLLCMHV